MSAKGFGDRLAKARFGKAARTGRTVTQVAVAKAIGVTSTTIGRWESGEKEPALAVIEKLATVLGVDPCYLAFGRNGGTLTRLTEPGSEAGEGEQGHGGAEVPAPAKRAGRGR